MDDQQKRDARRAYKDAERSRAREAVVLDEPELTDLIDYLDDHLAESACDHSFRLTERWAAERTVESSALVSSLQILGAYCDCEVVANVEPESIF